MHLLSHPRKESLLLASVQIFAVISCHMKSNNFFWGLSVNYRIIILYGSSKATFHQMFYQKMFGLIHGYQYQTFWPIPEWKPSISTEECLLHKRQFGVVFLRSLCRSDSINDKQVIVAFTEFPIILKMFSLIEFGEDTKTENRWRN